MKGMKSSKVDVLEKKVNALINVVKQILDENAYLKDLSVGTLETVKQFKEYDKAIEKLKEKLAEEASEAEKAKALGEIIK
jgi:cell shape-determining protein MreC